MSARARSAHFELMLLLLQLPNTLTAYQAFEVTAPVGVGQSNCSCDSFCAGGCSPFASTATTATSGLPNSQLANLTLFRFTPRGQRQLGDTNTGDVVGDLAFLLDRRALSARCVVEPTNERCFLAPWADMVFGRWTISTDLSRLGPYLACNPQYTSPDLSRWNVSNFTCSEDCVSPPYCPDPSLRRNNTMGGDGQLTCYCDRATWTVGVMPLTTGNAPGSSHARTRHTIHHQHNRSAPTPAPKPPQLLPQVCYYGFNKNISLPGSHRCVVPSNRVGLVDDDEPGFVFRNISDTNESSLLSTCCDTCSSVGRCTGFNVVQVDSDSESPDLFTCQLFTGEVSIEQVDAAGGGGGGGGGGAAAAAAASFGASSDGAGAQQPLLCRYAALRDTLPGGSWNWGCGGDVKDSGAAWYSTPKIGQCTDSATTRVPIKSQQCSWTLVGEPVFVNSTCVLQRLDAVVEVNPTTQRCIAACEEEDQNGFHAPCDHDQAAAAAAAATTTTATAAAAAAATTTTTAAAGANRTECWWKCYFIAVGGGGFPSAVPFSELVEAFAASFNVADTGSCAPASAWR